MRLNGSQNNIIEWSYCSTKTYNDPFNDVDLDVEIARPDGQRQIVPAFWAGDHTWRIRYASPCTGVHRIRSVCSDDSNAQLHGREEVLLIEPYTGDNALLRHGPLRVSKQGAYLEHCDGTPFLWLGDTWWFGLTARLRWPDEFQALTADRKAKGFDVVQIVAGLLPEVDDFDPRGVSEAGLPWEPGYSRIRPAFFDAMDLRLAHLVRAGIVPCVVGCWGYYLRFAGIEAIKKHWRNLIARYGAYPVVWCAAGEALLPFYGESLNDVAYREWARAGWTEITRYIKEADPYGHPLTIHPMSGQEGCDMVADPGLLDINMLQTGHRLTSLPRMIETTLHANARAPRLPVINGEPWYEGISGSMWQDAQRLALWASLLSGNAGHTYGANGLWQFNPPDDPLVGPNGSWGDTPWQEAAQLPGGGQMGMGRKLLERYPWWQFAPHPEWVAEPATALQPVNSYAAGIPGAVRVIYMPGLAWREPAVWPHYQVTVCGIESDAAYTAYFYNPRNGKATPIGAVDAEDGEWQMPRPPTREDWVLVLEDRAGLGRLKLAAIGA